MLIFPNTIKNVSVEDTNVMKLGVQPVFFVGPFFSTSFTPSKDEVLKSTTYNELTKTIEDVVLTTRDRLKDDVVFSEPLVATNRKEIQEASTQVKDADVLLALPLSGESQSTMVHIGLFKKSVIFYQRRNFPSHFACSAYGRLRSDGLVDAEIAFTPKDVAWLLHLQLAQKKIRSTRLVVFGQPGPSVPDAIADPAELSSRFGLWTKTVPIEELMKEYDQIAPEQYEGLARQWMQKTSAMNDVTEEQIQRAARLHLAIQHFISRLDANAAAVDCMMLLKLANVSPCISVEQLDDMGIPTGCEADLNSIFAKIILNYLSGKPAFMGNLIAIDPEENTLTIVHNTMPLLMAGLDTDPRPFTLWSYAKVGVQIVSEMTTDHEVTLLRIARNLRDAVVARGRIVSVNALAHARYVQVSIKLRDVKEFLKKLLGNHHALVYGDYIREFKYLATRLNLRAEEL